MSKLSVEQMKNYFSRLIQYGDRLKTDEALVREILPEHIDYIPKHKLYKFRKCTARNFETLADNSIWMSKANEFPDIFDSIINIDLNKNKHEIIEWVQDNLFRYVFEGIKKYYTQHDVDFKLTFEDLMEYVNTCFTKNGDPIPEKEQLFLNRFLYADQCYSLESVSSELNKYRKPMGKIIDSCADDVLDIIQKTKMQQRNEQLIYCMTENYTNRSLWENYAENYEGFCIEYEFSRCTEYSFDDYKNLLYLLPMIYKKTPPYFDIVPFFDYSIRQSILNEDNLSLDPHLQVDLYMQLFYKNNDYSYEHEWRFLIQNENNNKQYFPFVNAIYTGHRIKPENMQCLLTIADKLGVQLFCQKINKANNDYEYIPIERQSSY